MGNIKENTGKRVVVKFGGSNLKFREDLLNLVNIVKSYEEAPVIVVSAMYGVTDSIINSFERIGKSRKGVKELKDALRELHFQVVELCIKEASIRSEIKGQIEIRLDELSRYLKGIHYLGEIPDFASDMTQSYGEKLTSLILAGALRCNGIDAKESLPEQIGLITDGVFGNATVDFEKTGNSLNENLDDGKVHVIPGFYGISSSKKVTLLGRGGTDYSAASIARCIGAENLDFWKDVSGFMSGDPKITEDAVVIKELSYNEAAELSYFGAKILHPRTFEPILDSSMGVNLYNVKEFNGEFKAGTTIVDKGVVSRSVIKSVTCSDDFGILKLLGSGLGIKPGIMAEATACLNSIGINIKSVITSQTSINIMVGMEDLARSYISISELEIKGIKELVKMDDISLIALVGEGIPFMPGIAGRIFGAVSREKVNILMISMGASDVATYFVVHKKDKLKAVKLIHKEFFNENS